MFLWLILDLRPPRKVLKATTSKIKKAGASKRQRDSDDSDDVDYDPIPNEMAAASSVGDVGDESSEKEANEVEDDVTDLMGLDLPSRQRTAENYANARTVNQFDLPRDTNILFFKTEVQKDAYFGHLVKKNVFKHQSIDLAYMRSQPVMSALVDKFEAMGWQISFSIDVIGMRL